MSFLPTLDEFINENHKNIHFKAVVDDVCTFPEGKECMYLRMQAIQRIDDVVMFHRFVMATHENNRQVITPKFDAYNAHYKGIFDGVRDDDTEKMAAARMAFQPFNLYKQQSQIKCIANESIVINLWATIEQYTNRILKFLLSNEEFGSHQWDSLVKKFSANHIDLTSLSSYDTINELRVLNNKIKHSYVVDTTLARFPFFLQYNGKFINEVPLRIHDYTLSSYHFIVQLINIVDPSESYPDDESES